MRKIIIYGSSGLVGSRVAEKFKTKYQIIIPSHLEVDITKKEQIVNHICHISPDLIIYAVGLTSVDACQKEPKKAEVLNAKGPKIISDTARKLSIPVIYFSTDAVFDGTKSQNPYLETDLPNPISVYGKSKLNGEEAVLSASNQNLILRLITVYSAAYQKKLDSARKILEGLRKKEKVYAITDQIINPIFVDDIVSVLELMIQKKSRGIYHLGAKNYVTNFEFAKKIAKHFKFNENLILPITLEKFFKDSLVQRNHYCWLSTEKFTEEFGMNVLHTVDEGIELFKKQFSFSY